MTDGMVLATAAAQLAGYLGGRRRTFDLRTASSGDAFQEQVWALLRSILVPCHRVVGKDGSLTGYVGGLERKRFLLELEGAPVMTAGRPF